MLVKELIDRRNRFIKLAWIELIEKSNLKRAQAIHVTSDLEARELKSFSWQIPPITTIANGVDEIKNFGENELSADVKEIVAEKPITLFLGRMSWKKGLNRLLRAFALTDLGKLAIVGPDDEKLLPELTQLARDLQIEGRVRFLPRTVLGADKEHLFLSAQVFVLPSYSENFGNTVLEAMQRGVPVVVTPEVGAAEIVRGAGAGIVAHGDPALFNAAMRQLIEDPDLAGSMGEAGRRHVMEHYSWGSIAASMEDLYASVQCSTTSRH
jgi:glycosyltransferase involved in cell wall biosynthesis